MKRMKIFRILILLIMLGGMTVSVAAKPPKPGNDPDLPIEIFATDNRICTNDLYPSETEFMCSNGIVQIVNPQGDEWNIKVSDKSNKKIAFVILWTPRFWGWTLLVFAIDNGCMKDYKLDAYCIQYNEDRTAFRAWNHPIEPEIKGMQIVLENENYTGAPEISTYNVFIPMMLSKKK